MEPDWQRQYEPTMEEDIFRLLTLASLIAFGLVWGLNLVRVGISRDVLYSRHESVSFALFSRALILASIGGLIVYLAQPRSMAWSQLNLPTGVRFVGAPATAGGIALLRWVLSTLGRNFSMSLAIEGHTLITDGPYQWVRHPMYTAFATVFAGLFLLSANWFVGASAAIAFGATMTLRTPREEHFLIEAFGPRYHDYMDRTGRFLPRAGRLTRHWS